MRTIICSAIHFNNGVVNPHQPKNVEIGFVVCGRRHHDCYGTIYVLSKGSREYLELETEQGFITSDNFFVTREIAWEIAEKANQIKEDNRRFTQGRLFSEDLY